MEQKDNLSKKLLALYSFCFNRSTIFQKSYNNFGIYSKNLAIILDFFRIRL